MPSILGSICCYYLKQVMYAHGRKVPSKISRMIMLFCFARLKGE